MTLILCALVVALLCPLSSTAQDAYPSQYSYKAFLTVVSRKATREFIFTNKCNHTIWVGAQGVPLPSNGGWEMAPGKTQSIFVPDTWSAGRFWPRTGCAPTTDGAFVCQTGMWNLLFVVGKHPYVGNCGKKECAGAGGERPASLVEFTLGTTDFYDVSVVDGFTVGVKIEPLTGRYELVSNTALGISLTAILRICAL